LVAVAPIAKGRFWALVPTKSLQNRNFSVYALQR